MSRKHTTDPARSALAALYEVERLLPPLDRPGGVSVEARLGRDLRMNGPLVAGGRAYRWDFGAATIRRDATEATARRTTEPLARMAHSEVYPRGYTL